MVIVYLCGGLGNQLFQYALGRRISLRYQTELYFDVRSFAINTTRDFALPVYPIVGTVAGAKLLKRTIHHSLLDRLLPRRFIRTVKESGFCFEPAVLECGNNVYLHGYWQSEHYFRNIREILLAELQPHTPLEGKNRDVGEKIATCESVSVHVRRSDYVHDPKANSVHGTCSADYYREAFRRMNAVLKNPYYFVFSDDPAWARRNLGLVNKYFCDHNGPGVAHEDLRLMSRCRHHIIANSSFSWWGAWLGTHPEKKVIAPRKWFAAGNLDTVDLMPSKWKRI